MKRNIMIIILTILVIILIIRYVTINYSITYNVDNYTIKEYYKNNRMYFEIQDNSEYKSGLDDVIYSFTYNFDMSMKRKLFKKMINRVEKVEHDDEVCIYPNIKGKKTYPLCYKNGEQTSYYLMENNEMKDFINSLGINESNEPSLDTFKFYNNLSKNEYIAVYKYNGFYILNDDKIKSINLFDKDRYDNTPCIRVDNYLILPEEAEYEFKKFIVIDLKTNKYTYIEGNQDISFDSIFLGYIKKKVYLLDNKNSKEYEIDLKEKEIKLIGDYEKGFRVYRDGKLKTGMISELKENIGFGNEEVISNYEYKVIDNKLYKMFKDNQDIKTVLYNKEVNIIKEYDNELFFLDNDTLYKYNPLSGIKIILKNEEINYNQTNFIYIYINK